MLSVRHDWVPGNQNISLVEFYIVHQNIFKHRLKIQPIWLKECIVSNWPVFMMFVIKCGNIFFRVLHFHYIEFNIGIAILHMHYYCVWISCSMLFQKYLYTMKIFVFSFFFLLLLHYWSSSSRMFLLFHTTQNQMLYSTTISEIYMCMRVTLFYLWQKGVGQI